MTTETKETVVNEEATAAPSSSLCYDSMVAEQSRLCRLMGWEMEQVGLMPCKDSYGIVLGMWPASELCEKLEELFKAVCDQQLASIGQEFLDGMAEPVTVECPFCQTPITKDSESCCASMIAAKAISQKYGKPRFTAHEHDGEWVLRVHHPNGSYAGIGVLNGEIEAKAVCKTLNESVASDSFEESRWFDYFDDENAAKRAGSFAWEPKA